MLKPLFSLALLSTVATTAFADDIACGSRITSNTTLSADLDCSNFQGNAITIDASNVIFNGGGHKIISPAGVSAIYVNSGTASVVVKNTVVSASGIAIKIDGSNALVQNNVLDGSNIGVLTSQPATIVNNKINGTESAVNVVTDEKILFNNANMKIKGNQLQNSRLCAVRFRTANATVQMSGGSGNQFSGSTDGFCLEVKNLFVRDMDMSKQLILKRIFFVANADYAEFTRVNVSSIAQATSEQSREGIDLYRVKNFLLVNVISNCNDTGVQIQNEVSRDGSRIEPNGVIKNSQIGGNTHAGVHVVIHDTESKYGTILVCKNQFTETRKENSLIVRSEKAPGTNPVDFSNVNRACSTVDTVDRNDYKVISSNSVVCDPHGGGNHNPPPHGGHGGHKGSGHKGGNQKLL